MKKYPMKRTIVHKQFIQGATLVEVLVSVFLLTFGILGLMAAQLNSVSAVNESENRAIAAQAAENLAEAMQANPDLVKGGKRTYDKYRKNAWVDVRKIDSCTDDKPAAPTPIGGASASKKACNVGKGPVTKTELAQIQLDEFQYVLSQMPNTVDLKYTICLDEVSSLKGESESPDLNNPKCSTSGTSAKPVIKVIWSSVGSQKETSTGIPDKSSQLYYLVLPE